MLCYSKKNSGGACDLPAAHGAQFGHHVATNFAKTDVPALQKHHARGALMTYHTCLHFHFLPLRVRFNRTYKIIHVLNIDDALLPQAIRFINHKQTVPRAVFQPRNTV